MKLQKTILILQSNQVLSERNGFISEISCKSLILSTLVYLICLLSVPLYQLDHIIWFSIYPILMSPIINRTYSKIFLQSLYVVPLIIPFAIFNPFIDKTEAFKIENISLSVGWITFFSIIIRGLLSMQSLLILIKSNGFFKICDSLRSLGVPKILTLQLILLYRYMGVLMEEVLRMQFSICSRGYGKSSFPIKMWTQFIGCLFINTLERSRRIHYAMLARGFEGDLSLSELNKMNLKDYSFLIVSSSIFIILRFINLSSCFFNP